MGVEAQIPKPEVMESMLMIFPPLPFFHRGIPGLCGKKETPKVGFHDLVPLVNGSVLM
jgi:hypothetical protein